MRLKLLVRTLLDSPSLNYLKQYYNSRKTKKQNIDLYTHLQKNIKYYNIHAGERCFILGNGPSLKQQDLSKLENEIVFTCNQISRNPEFKKIKTNYHFWADPIFFNLDKNKPEDMEVLETMKNVVTDDNNPQCFFASDAFDFVKYYNLSDQLRISFYQPGLIIHNQFNMDIDFRKLIPSMHTVVQYAILLAIYMGFKEIYILGSEFTSILLSVNVRLQNNLNQYYAYDITENEKTRMNNRANIVTFEQELYSFYHVVKNYRLLNEYCQKRKIKLVNCTPGGLIESLPREKYKDVISKGAQCPIKR